jgi:Leucine-rich repeat (LRR) protein
LESLQLYGNQLETLPSFIGKMTNLRSLSLHNNQINNLPAEIGQLTNLQSLNLKNNKLDNLPVELGSLSETMIYLEENSLKSFSKEITKQGTKSVMSFLQQAQKGKKD